MLFGDITKETVAIPSEMPKTMWHSIPPIKWPAETSRALMFYQYFALYMIFFSY